MEQIRAWVLAVCFACIAAGILGQLSSSRTRFSEAMVLNTVCTRLEDTVRSALAENGIAYTEVDVALDADSETVEVADVTVIVPGGTDVSGVEDVVTKALGTHVPVTVNEEG